MAAFAGASDAVAWALALQLSLAEGPIAPRLGLRPREVILRDPAKHRPRRQPHDPSGTCSAQTPRFVHPSGDRRTDSIEALTPTASFETSRALQGPLRVASSVTGTGSLQLRYVSVSQTSPLLRALAEVASGSVGCLKP